MNNYGRNQMNNRTRQGNMQNQNRMNRNNCGCNTPAPVDNCGCNNNARPVDNCGCNNNARPVDNCGCNNNARPVDNCGCNTPARPADNYGCDHHDHHPVAGTAGCNASRYDQLSGMALAIAYVPWQTYCQLYDLEDALCNGTVFKELKKDFLRGCCS